MGEKIYEELTIKDYRVFFSKISLEDKIGEEYEARYFNNGSITVKFYNAETDELLGGKTVQVRE